MTATSILLAAAIVAQPLLVIALVLGNALRQRRAA